MSSWSLCIECSHKIHRNNPPTPLHFPLCFALQPGHSVGMLAAVEHGPILCSDSNILCLSWKGRVPKSEKDKPVCRRRYYEEGWLATGNGRGVVGVTFTSSHCRRDRTTPQRINFNLRGHNSEVWWTCFVPRCHRLPISDSLWPNEMDLW